jgi:ribonuclease Z
MMTRIRFALFFAAVGVAAASWIATCAAWRADRVIAGVRPLDPASFERLTLVALGTGGGYENPDRRGPALAVGLGTEVVLVDAGRGVAEGLRAAQIPVAQPGLVVLTSLLPENTVGLDDLLQTGWLEGRSEPLRVVGPPGTAALCRGVADAHAAGNRARGESLGLPEAGTRCEADEWEGGGEAVHGALRLRAAALSGGPLPALAWRVEAEGRAVVLAPVGWGEDAVLELARGAQLLVREAAYVPDPELAAEIGLEVDPERLRRERALHTSIEAVGELAQRAGVDTLVLVRLRPPPVYAVQITSQVDDRFGGRILVADDGDTFTP